MDNDKWEEMLSFVLIAIPTAYFLIMGFAEYNILYLGFGLTTLTFGALMITIETNLRRLNNE